MYKIRQSFVETAKTLPCNFFNKNILMVAAVNGYNRIIVFLLLFKCGINLTDDYGAVRFNGKGDNKVENKVCMVRTRNNTEIVN